MAIPRTICIALLAILVAGCATKSSNNSKSQTPHDPQSDLPPKVGAAGVTYEIYGPAPANKLYYVVKTDRVNATLGSDQLETGVSGNVSGTIYTKGPCTFKAASARGAKASPKSQELDLLTLTGSVEIHCQKPKGNLFCDRLTADMNAHIIKAFGHVRFDTASGIHGTLPEAWATQDLTRIASPRIFQEGIGR